MYYSDETKAAAVLATDLNGGAIRKTAQEIGINRGSLSNWRRGHQFSAEAARMREEKRREITEQLWQMAGLSLLLAEGKAEAATYPQLMQGAGVAVSRLVLLEQSEREAEAHNIERMKAQIADVIARHVEDPYILQAIANDLDQITLPQYLSESYVTLEPEDSPDSGGTDASGDSGEEGQPLRPDDPDEITATDTVYTQSGAVVIPAIDGPYGESEGPT